MKVTKLTINKNKLQYQQMNKQVMMQEHFESW